MNKIFIVFILFIYLSKEEEYVIYPCSKEKTQECI